MLLTETGFDRTRLTPALAELLGDGSGLVCEAGAAICESIEPVHFLCFLVRTPGTIIRARYLDPAHCDTCLLYTSPSPRDGLLSRMPSSA